MADVTRDRAQLIIVGGLALAVTLIALAVILNSAIYTGNLATRESNQDTRAAVEQIATVEGSVERALRWVNVHEPSNPGANFTEEITVLNDRFRKETSDGVLTSVEVLSRQEGTRMAQLDETKDFTAGGSTNDGTEDWTLVDHTNETRAFTMRIERSTLFDANLTTDRSTITTEAFDVAITEQSTGETYHVYIYQSSVTGDAYLMTDEPGGGNFGDTGDLLLEVIEGSCSATGPEVVVDFTEHTFGPAPDIDSPYGVFADPSGKHCSELDFYGSGTDYQIRYLNTYDSSDSPTAKGEYELVVTQDSHAHGSNFYAYGDGEPFAHTAIVGADLQLSYETDEVTYQTNWTVTPKRQRIFTGVAPAIEQFNVTRSDPADFTVDWETVDADGDMNEVRLTLYNRTSETVNATETYTTNSTELSGDEGSDSGVMLSDTGGGSGHTYEVHIRVTDAKGHVTHTKKVFNP